MERTYRLGFVRRSINRLLTPLIKVGLAPGTSYLLSTRGRRTGRVRTNPVTLVIEGDRRWLVAPYGTVSWVHNARAAGYVTLARRGKARDWNVKEVSPAEAAPVLKRYLRQAPVVRPFFDAKADSSESEFEREAERHPVFELTPRTP